jgi:hypothetical protein
MFNLEQSISEWRGQMLSAGVKNPDIVDELESHLREDWARRVQSGESEEQAFEGAVQGVGQASLLKDEFAKLSGKKWAWLRKLKGIMAGVFVPVPSLSTFTPGARWTWNWPGRKPPALITVLSARNTSCSACWPWKPELFRMFLKKWEWIVKA